MRIKFTIYILIILYFGLTPSNAGEITVIHNVKGHSINNDKHVTFQALAFENGKILSIGTSDSIKQQYPDSQKINGFGSSLLPGLYDSHGHVLSLAKKEREFSLKGVTSLEESLNAIETYANKSKRDWIIVNDWNYKSWKNPILPSKHDLDKLSTDKLIWVKSIDGNIGWANSKVMLIAQTNKQKGNSILGGSIQINDSGEQTGIFFDNALSIINKKTMNSNFFSSEGELKRALKKLVSFYGLY